MQYFDTPDPRKVLRNGVLLSLFLLALLIAFLALTNQEPDAPPPHGPHPALAADLNVVEQLVPLTDGRTVSCLLFTAPVPQVDCDWPSAGKPG